MSPTRASDWHFGNKIFKYIFLINIKNILYIFVSKTASKTKLNKSDINLQN